MNKPKDTSNSTQPSMSRKKRIIIGVTVAAIVLFSLLKLPTVFAETKEFLQFIPGIPNLIGTIGNGAAAEKADLKPVEAAVLASSARVTSVDLTNSRDGFAEVVNVKLIVDGSTPLTQEELLPVLTSIWKTVPFEPTYIMLNAKTESGEYVNVKTASNMLAGVKVIEYGSNTVIINNIDQLLGPWKKSN